MTAGTDPESTARRQWAAEQLGVGPQASADEVRAALLRRLPEADWAPPPEWPLAWQVLTGQPLSAAPDVDEELALAEEDRLRGEVEAFAGRFWSLPAPERRRRWRELTACCARVPPLRARLRRLEAGLDVAALGPGREEPQVVELAGCLQDLFLLRPAARAAAEQAFLRRVKPCASSWERAARRLQRRYPSLAALQPALVSSLASWTQRERHLVKMRRRLRPRPVSQPRQKSSSGPGWAVFVAAMLIIRGLVAFHGGSQPSQPTYPSISVPSRYRNWQPNNPGAMPGIRPVDPETRWLEETGRPQPLKPPQGLDNVPPTKPLPRPPRPAPQGPADGRPAQPGQPGATGKPAP